MNKFKVVSYENKSRGIYKYQFTSEANAIDALQKFIKYEQIDTEIKVELRDIEIPEERRTSWRCDPADPKRMSVFVLQCNAEQMYIFSPRAEHESSIEGFLEYIRGWGPDECRDLLNIHKLYVFEQGINEMLGITAESWGGCDPAFMTIG